MKHNEKLIEDIALYVQGEYKMGGLAEGLYLDFAKDVAKQYAEEANLLGISVNRQLDQSKFDLIGYQAYYKDGSNKFYKELDEINNSIASNPLVDVKQVGILKEKQ